MTRHTEEGLTVEDAAVQARDESVRAAILRDLITTVESYLQNRETGAVEKLVQLDEGPFRAPRCVVDAVRADVMMMVIAARERRDGFLRRKVP